MDARWVVNALVVISALAVAWLVLLLHVVRAEHRGRMRTGQVGSSFTVIDGGAGSAPSRSPRPDRKPA